MKNKNGWNTPKLMKDKRYVGDKIDWTKLDEAGQWISGEEYFNYWYTCGIDPYKDKE